MSTVQSKAATPAAGQTPRHLERTNALRLIQVTLSDLRSTRNEQYNDIVYGMVQGQILLSAWVGLISSHEHECLSNLSLNAAAHARTDAKALKSVSTGAGGNHA